ncbi:MAG: hypothetical protein ACPGR2_06020 [Psychrobium sp.]
MNKLISTVAALAFIPMSVSANNLCEIESTGIPTVIIDSNKGTVDSGQLFYKDLTALHIVFTNQNPFSHQYKFNIASANLDSIIIRDALTGILGLTSNAPQENLDGIPKRMGDDSKQHGPSFILLNKRTKKLQTAVKSYQDRLTAARKLTSCKSILTASEDVKAQIETINHLSNGYQTLRDKAVTESNSPMFTNKAGYKALLGTSLKILTSLLKDEHRLAANLKLINEVIDKQGKGTLYTTKTLSKPSSPQSHTLSLAHWPIDKPTETKAKTIVINVGESRFSYSVGLGLGSMKEGDYEVKTRNSANLSTDDSAGKYVALVDESDQQFGVIGQLNSKLGELKSGQSIMWSLGVSLNTSGGNTDFGFYTGPSISFLDDSFIITAGYHLYKMEKPLSGYENGAALPDEFSGDIPMTSKTENGWLIGFTWKFD